METSFKFNYKYDYTGKRFYRKAVYKVGIRGTALASLFLVLAGCASVGERCELHQCYDGDTCTVACSGSRVKVRLHCIDAPEMDQEPWGKQSRDHLRERTPTGAAVELVSVTRDKYKRTVGVLFLDGVNLNLRQVQDGWAVVYPKYCAEPVYYQAQEDAETMRRGIWRDTGTQQRPWDWRKTKKSKGAAEEPQQEDAKAE